EIKKDDTEVPYIFESMSRRIGNEKVKKTSRNIEHLKIINEFGGINFNGDEVHYFRESGKKKTADGVEFLYEDYSVKIN
ncbi:hypothetical protein ABK046_52135, partial [Streptomyces caeruleatus]